MVGEDRPWVVRETLVVKVSYSYNLYLFTITGLKWESIQVVQVQKQWRLCSIASNRRNRCLKVSSCAKLLLNADGPKEVVAIETIQPSKRMNVFVVKSTEIPHLWVLQSWSYADCNLSNDSK